MVVSGSHDHLLVGLSILIAVFASYTALDLAGRVRASEGRARRAWLGASALAMGGGIWAMHFVAMLAFTMPAMAVQYDLGLTMASLLTAIAVTGAGFAVMSRWPGSTAALATAGLVMGLGVVSMHYMGMAAMRMPAALSYDRLWLSLSVLIAIGAATAALWLASRNTGPLEQGGAAVVMGVAVAGMHYTGMRAAIFTMAEGGPAAMTPGGVGQADLAALVAGATFLILFLSLTAAMFDRRFATLAQREADALRQSEERFRSLYRGTPLPLHALDREGRLDQVSDTWLRLLGYDREEVVGRPLINFMTEASARQFRQGDWPALIETDLLEAREYRVVAKSGDVLDVVAAAHVQRGGDGEFIRVLGGLTDITQRKQAEEALRQAQKMEAVGQLTGGVAHDFNNLLAAVIGNLELLRKRLPEGDAKAEHLLNGAFEGATRGASLTQRLLAFARRQDLRREPVDVAELVSGMSNLLQRTLGPRIAIHTRFDPGLPPVLTDPHQLELAVLNLVVNARDAMPEGGLLEISAGEAGDAQPPAGATAEGAFVRIVVADQGHGMDAATLARATEPFFTTKGVGKGTGLGLSMVHGFLGQSGGWLVLKSRPGQGTSVELHLPVADAQAARAETGSSRGVQAFSQRRTILVVDDDGLVLANTAAMLEDLGHAVIAIPGGPEALERFASAPEVDLLVTDQLMPRLTGMELAGALRRQRPGLPVLIVSGFAELDAAEANGMAVLRKPFRQAELAEALAALGQATSVVPFRRAGLN